MILFEEIYNKAVVLFDDPKITTAYEENKIAFCKHMYGFFNNVSIYEPVIIGQILSDVTNPIGRMEIFDADGSSSKFNVEMDIPENSIIMFHADGNICNGTYNAIDKTVNFDGEILDTGKEYGLEYYYPGSYNGNFSAISNDNLVTDDIEQKVKNILARLLVIAWAESVKNMLVDIQGILRDTDFKLTPNSQILSAKVKWIDDLYRQNLAEQNKLSWRIRYSHNRGKFKRF
jgi:hypothetical protein